MRKLLFALVVMTMGGFAFAGGSPASAMTAGATAGVNEIIKETSTVDQVRWVRRCWWSYGHRHCRNTWVSGYRYWKPWWGHHHRHCWWRYGRRYCRY
jgi:hypothetical protein